MAKLSSEGSELGADGWWQRARDLIESVLADPPSHEMILGVLLTLCAIVVLLLVFRVSQRFLENAHAKLESWRGTRIAPLKIQSYEIMSAERITDVLKGLVKTLRIAALVVAFYIAIPVILSFFPWSRRWVDFLLPYLLAPVYRIGIGFIDFLPNLFSIIVIVIATRYLMRLNRTVFSEVEKRNIVFPGFHFEWAQPTSKLLGFLIIAFAVVLISPYLPGFGSPAFQGISIFLGVLLSLGSTAAIANIVAGAALTYMRAYSVGDRVKIADTVGDVREKTLLVTRVRTIKNVEVTIPNAMVLGSHMINFSALANEQGLVLHTTLTIGYDVPWRRVRELLIEAGNATEHVKEAPPPFVFQTALNDFSIAYELNVYTREASRSLAILSQLHENIQDRFNEAGIEIMSPAYTALRDGNQATMPAEYLPQEQEPKGFRFLRVPAAFKNRG